MSVIIAQNQTGGALTLNELPIPNNQIPASGNVTLTNYATVSEIQNDSELFALIRGGSVLLNVDGVTLTQAESAAAASPVIQATGAFANYYNDAAYTGITTSVSTLPFPDTRISNAAFTIDGSGEQVTINTAGTYRVDFGCSPAETSNNDITADMWLELDTGSGFSEVPGTRARFFHDSNTEEGGNSSFAIITMASTDIFRIRAQVVDGSDQLNTLANSLRLSIHTVGANGAAGATGPQGPAGSGSTIIIEDEGSNIPNTPHSNLNFVGAGVKATDGGSGVATITIPGQSAGANIAQCRRTWDLTINTSATTIPFDATDFEDSNYTVAPFTGLITINTSGVYKISYSVYFDTSANARRTVDAWVENNTVEIVPSRSTSYARNNTDDTASLGATFMVDLTATDVIRLRAQSTGTSGTAIGKGNRMWICLEFMRT